jgi:DNA-binding transcriptional MerR regulator
MTNDSHRTRWLPMGDFAAATQLSAKALRLYAEQRLLVPARVDEATSYRYYRSDQVPQGRLIRTLREMGLSLADIGAVVAVDDTAARRLLDAFAKVQDHRYAREKRAYRSALLQLQPVSAAQVPSVIEREREATMVACREFISDRQSFIERYRAELQQLLAALAETPLRPTGPGSCRLIDPLSEEEGRAEIVVPLRPGAALPPGVSFRQLVSTRCAVVALDGGLAHSSQFAGALDTLFDWFDRRGHAAVDCPLVTVDEGVDSLRIEISWSFTLTQNS